MFSLSYRPVGICDRDSQIGIMNRVFICFCLFFFISFFPFFLFFFLHKRSFNLAKRSKFKMKNWWESCGSIFLLLQWRSIWDVSTTRKMKKDLHLQRMKIRDLQWTENFSLALIINDFHRVFPLNVIIPIEKILFYMFVQLKQNWDWCISHDF